MVAKYGRYFGAPFKGQSDINQGYLLSTTIFNVVVDVFRSHWFTVLIAAEGTAAVDTTYFHRAGHAVETMDAISQAPLLPVKTYLDKYIN